MCKTRPMDSNVAELLSRAATQEPDKTVLSEAATGRTITCSGLDELVQRVVQGLDDAGMVAGYRVMIASGNSIEFVAAYLGALRAGMVVVPVNPRSATGELIRMLADSGTRMVIADGDTDLHGPGGRRRSRRGDGGSRLRGHDATADRHRRHHARAGRAQLGPAGRDVSAGPSPRRVDPETLAVLLYTSGTSGRPRAAMLSHRALLANIEQVAEVMPQMITGRDVVLGVLPLFHVYGLNAVLGQVLRQQARLVLVDGFDPEGSLDLIEDEAISVLPVAPPVFAYWMQLPGLEDRLGPVRLVLSGSAPLDPGAHRRVHRADRRRDPPGLRPHRGGAGRHLHAVQREPDVPVGGCRAARDRDPAGRRARQGAARRGRRRDPDPRRQPVLRLLARRRRRARQRRLVGRPATSATSTPAATSTWSTGSRSW